MRGAACGVSGERFGQFPVIARKPGQDARDTFRVPGVPEGAVPRIARGSGEVPHPEFHPPPRGPARDRRLPRPPVQGLGELFRQPAAGRAAPRRAPRPRRSPRPTRSAGRSSRPSAHAEPEGSSHRKRSSAPSIRAPAGRACSGASPGSSAIPPSSSSSMACFAIVARASPLEYRLRAHARGRAAAGQRQRGHQSRAGEPHGVTARGPRRRLDRAAPCSALPEFPI